MDCQYFMVHSTFDGLVVLTDPLKVRDFFPVLLADDDQLTYHGSVLLGCQYFQYRRTYHQSALSTALLEVRDLFPVLLTLKYFQVERLLAIQYFDLILWKYGLFLPYF